jgi:RimJ/RimL family protein N-acetyltransferase
MQPTLQTTRLVLRPATLADVDVLWALWTTPAVREFLWDDREIARDEAFTMLAECVALSAQGLGLWLLSEARPQPAPATGSFLGCAGLLPVSTAAQYETRLSGLIEPLVALTPSAWGRGYAPEALVELMRYASRSLGMTRLAGVTEVPNTASDRMLRHAGFTVLSEVAGPRYPLRTYLWQESVADRSAGAV